MGMVNFEIAKDPMKKIEMHLKTSGATKMLMAAIFVSRLACGKAEEITATCPVPSVTSDVHGFDFIYAGLWMLLAVYLLSGIVLNLFGVYDRIRKRWPKTESVSSGTQKTQESVSCGTQQNGEDSGFEKLGSERKDFCTECENRKADISKFSEEDCQRSHFVYIYAGSEVWHSSKLCSFYQQGDQRRTTEYRKCRGCVQKFGWMKNASASSTNKIK